MNLLTKSKNCIFDKNYEENNLDDNQLDQIENLLNQNNTSTYNSGWFRK